MKFRSKYPMSVVCDHTISVSYTVVVLTPPATEIPLTVFLEMLIKQAMPEIPSRSQMRNLQQIKNSLRVEVCLLNMNEIFPRDIFKKTNQDVIPVMKVLGCCKRGL